MKTFIKRIIEKHIEKLLFKNKAIIIYGARQTGKTTLLKMISSKLNQYKQLWLNCDEADVRNLLTDTTSSHLKRVLGENEIIFIDEAQRVKNIGITLKLIVDNFPEKQLIITGSSSLDLFSRLKEPLTGRKYQFTLFPFSLEELESHFGALETLRIRDFVLTYGSYPEIIVNQENAEINLKELSDSYLYKDLLIFEGIKKHEVLHKLLQALALQVGNEVSYSELSQLVDIDKNTVEKYIHLLEECFVIFKLSALSKNRRKEIKKKKKIYFWDTGVRNALLSDFKQPDLRTDIGGLWENFVITERIKFLKNNNINANYYFWRTAGGKEIDFIEEINGKYYAYEIKWNPQAKARLPKTFTENYNLKKFHVIHRENYLDIINTHPEKF